MIKRSRLTCALFLIFAFAQAQPAAEACFEKCFHAGGQLRPTQVNYFQYPSMNKYDVHHLKLDIAVEANNRNITGSALTSATAIQNLDSFICELRDFLIIDSIFVNGVKTTTYTRASDHVFVQLNPVIPAGTNFQVLIFYRGTAGAAGVYIGTNLTNGLIYTATLSESYQAREWFPVKQLLKDKIDSADIWITTTNTNLAGSNGLLQAAVDLPGNKKQFQWKTRYPMAYYLVSFAVANYQEYKNYAKPAALAPDSVLIQHYIVNNPDYFNTNKANLDKTPAFLERLSVLYGLYPFYREKYGHAHAGIGGGMEHQTMSTMNSFGSTLIAHELAHQWFGDNVTCATWNHIWLNEGFASYSEYLLIESLTALFPGLTPADYMLGVHNNVMSIANGSVFVPDASLYDESRIFNLRLSYNKGSAIIHNLRFEMQNDNLFYQTLQTYQQQFKDTVATAEDFKTIAQTISGKNLTDFFNQWYYGEGYPTFNVDYSKQGDDLVLFVNQTTSAPIVTPLFKGLYEVKITTQQGDTLVKINVTENNQTFKFRSNRIPTGVVFDPNNWVINKVGSITTGINDPGNTNEGVILYPNPSPGTFHLEYPANTFEQAQVFDISGKLLLRETLNGTQKTITTALTPGSYLIKLFGKKETSIKKLLIVR